MSRSPRNPRWLDESPLRQHFGPSGKAKRGFDAEADADVYAVKLNGRPNASKRRPFRVYPCRTCQRFHVGRKPA